MVNSDIIMRRNIQSVAAIFTAANVLTCFHAHNDAAIFGINRQAFACKSLFIYVICVREINFICFRLHIACSINHVAAIFCACCSITACLRSKFQIAFLRSKVNVAIRRIQADCCCVSNACLRQRNILFCLCHELIRIYASLRPVDTASSRFQLDTTHASSLIFFIFHRCITQRSS